MVAWRYAGSIELPEFLRMFRNKLLDLDQVGGRALLDWLGARQAGCWLRD